MQYIYNRNWLKGIFLFYLFFLPLVPRYVGFEISTGGGAPFLSVFRVATIILLFIWAFWFMLSLSQGAFRLRLNPNTSINKLTIRVVFYLAAILVSVIFSRDFKVSLQYFLSERALIGVLVFFSVYSVFRGKDAIHAVLKIWVLSSIVVLLVGFFEIVFGASIFSLVDLPGRREIAEGFTQVKERAGFMRVQSTLDNPITLSVYLLMTFPIVVYYFNMSRTMTGKLFYGVLSWFIIAVVLLTFVRSAWLILLFSIVILLRKKYLYLALSGLVVLMALTLGVAGGLDVSEKIERVSQSIILQGERQVSKSTAYRIEMLMAGLETFETSPVVGVGPGNFGEEVEGSYFGEWVNFEHHENYYITVLVESGLLGLGAFLFLVIGVIQVATRNKRQIRERNNNTSLQGVILLSIINYLGMGIFLDTFSYYQISFFFWVLVALVLSISALTERPGRSLSIRGEYKFC